MPGLAKTLAVSTLAKDHRHRLPPHPVHARTCCRPTVTGTTVYNRETGDFTVKQGPVFSNIILADEINRAPAKVQSALLEAMQERQVTIGGETFPMDDPFLVLATQNPIEQEGTYPLPEAQVDRFLLKLKVGYPSRDEERLILERMAGTGDSRRGCGAGSGRHQGDPLGGQCRLRRREDQDLHPGHRLRDAGSRGRRPGPGAADRLGRFAAGDPRAHPAVAGAGAAQGGGPS